MKAISLLSGGLDSILATKLMMEQGLEISALNFSSVFCTCTAKTRSCSAAQSAVRQLGIELTVLSKGDDYLQIVKNPPHGYGRHLNPCIDCRIFMFRRARDHMETAGASFLITGEVLGERPMSQRRHAMKLIEREAGVEGLVVRPLSAALLEPSIPEKKGWVDRTRLLAISGRGRRPQIALADTLGITDYPCPAGGCRLTDADFAGRMWDLFVNKPEFNIHDVTLLKVGRHFRLTPEVKIVVGRNEDENARLAALARADDVRITTLDVKGPLTVVLGDAGLEELRTAMAITAFYTKLRHASTVRLSCSTVRSNAVSEHEIEPADDEGIEKLRIGQMPRDRKSSAGSGDSSRVNSVS